MSLVYYPFHFYHFCFHDMTQLNDTTVWKLTHAHFTPESLLNMPELAELRPRDMTSSFTTPDASRLHLRGSFIFWLRNHDTVSLPSSILFFCK